MLGKSDVQRVSHPLRSWNRLSIALWSMPTLLVVTLAGCGSDPTGPTEPLPAVELVAVTPDNALLKPGDSLKLDAIPKTANGAPLPGKVVRWSSSDTLVATVTNVGLVRALTAGRVSIRAVVDGRMGQANLTVSHPADQTPRLDSLSPATVPAKTPVVTIVLHGANFSASAAVLWDGTSRPSQWISSAEMRLTIGPSDLTAERTVLIVVRNPDINGGDSEPRVFTVGPIAVDRVTVSPTSAVIPVNGQTELSATAWSADGSVLTGRSFQWTSSSPATASVSGSGVVVGHRAGEVLITVMSEGRGASARISVIAPVVSVAVTPNFAVVIPNTRVELKAITFGPAGSVLTGRLVTWSSEQPNIATVDANGIVTGVTKGTARIFAESEGKVGSATVEVRQFSDGPVQGYDLRGMVGTVIMPEVGTMPWVDELGQTHNATLYLTGGTMEMDSRVNGYTQSLAVTIFVVGRGLVGDTTWVDQGSYWIDVFNNRFVFESAVNNTSFFAVNGGVGELYIDQTIGTAPLLKYRWVVQ